MHLCQTDRFPRVPDPEIRLALEHPDGRRHSLPHCEPLMIGSGPDCTLRLADPFVSSHHARVRFLKSGAYRIEDLGSTNGTLVDGVPVGRALLEPGMRVDVGGVRLTVTRIDRETDENRPRRSASGPAVPGLPTGHRLIGRSRILREVRRTLEKYSQLALPVLIHGETGTGKELAAMTVHEFGPRFAEPFVPINCGAIPESLFESELFGHRRGAYTGAHRDHEGAFVRAGRGTVFLDEIGELPLSAQAKLLRVLETRMVRPIGSEGEQAIACRIVAATHRDLGEMVREGRFREDLFHRLSVLEVSLPPLRRRRGDIPVLLDHFLTEAASELGREVVLSQEAARDALAHDWPGNVRSLRNAVMRAAALSEGPIMPEDLVPASEPKSRGDVIVVPRGDYASMTSALIHHVVAEEGSIRRAARVLGLPRSTLGTWVRQDWTRDSNPSTTDAGGSVVPYTRLHRPARTAG
ncbi:sigma 54-interacting transcriptional regulator [Nannocystaceae bacterium ST9]